MMFIRFKNELIFTICVVVLGSQNLFSQEHVSADSTIVHHLDSLVLSEIPKIILSEQTSLLFAQQVDSGKLNNVKLLLQLGANPNTPWQGTTPLIYAAQGGYYKIVKELIAYGAEANTPNPDGFTPLHYSVFSNNDSIAELLILNGANPHPANKFGISPLHYASLYGNSFLTYLLLYYGAHIDSTDNFGNTPLMVSVYSGAYSTCNYLLENWADVDKPDQLGYTPLMVAAQFNDTALVRLLLDYGANTKSKTLQNTTVLALAMENRSDEAINLLMLKGAATEEFHAEVSYAELAHRNGYKSLSKQLHKEGSPFSYQPKLSGIIPFVGTVINANDFYLLAGTKAQISKLGIQFGAELGFRPFYMPIHVDQEYITYQFFEQRQLLGMVISKEVLGIKKRKKTSLSLQLGLKYIRSWGRYSFRSSMFKASSYNLFTPEIAVTFTKNHLQFSASGQYLLMDHLRNQPFSLNLTIGYLFDLAKPKIYNKRIKWL